MSCAAQCDVLPVEIELLGVLEHLRRPIHAGIRARTIAEAACSCTRWVGSTSTPSKPAPSQLASEFLLGQGAGDAAGPLLHVAPGRLVHVRIGDHVADGEATTGLEHPSRLAKDSGLVPGEVDHAVGDDHVHRGVRKRHLLDRAPQELGVLDPRLALVGTGQLQHLVGHLHSVGPAGGANAAGREQDVDAASRAEVQHRLTLSQLGHRGRVAAAERGRGGCVGKRIAVGLAVERGPEDSFARLGQTNRAAATCDALPRLASRTAIAADCVAGADRLPDVRLGGGGRPFAASTAIAVALAAAPGLVLRLAAGLLGRRRAATAFSSSAMLEISSSASGLT